MFNRIRNFVIIAHIDHGKSTLADRLLEITGTVEKRKMREQFLDMHPLEREKGITIKMQPVRMRYGFCGEEFILNLIDTPGHVDFSYEVSRALAAVEGAVLLVDATQGVQAQTIANLHLAQREGLLVIPAINKIDLPSADLGNTAKEISELLGVLPEAILNVSAKTGAGVEDLLRAIIEKVPAPLHEKEISSYFSALVFDSIYDPYQGVVAYIRVMEGSIAKNAKIKFLATGATGEVLEVGTFLPWRTPVASCGAGEIGYIATGMKEPEKVRVGDTVVLLASGPGDPLPGYREPAPMVYASVFPENQDAYELLRESLKKLKLNDAALTFEPEEASALGRGFRAGFLGMLHMEIISERLRREYNLNLVFTSPSVSFRVRIRSGEDRMVYAASRLPESHLIESIEEPRASVEIVTPSRFLGILTTLINDHEGRIEETTSLTGDRMLIKFRAPLREIIIDFYDRLKSVSNGFASMAYEMAGWSHADLVRLDLLVAGEKVSALAEIVPREKSYMVARERVAKLKEILPRELFAVALQAEVEGRVIARETISALKKDVTGYLYGGDRTRKMKLWKKQQKGKKKLKEMGHVEIPPDVFLKMLKK